LFLIKTFEIEENLETLSESAIEDYSFLSPTKYHESSYDKGDERDNV
jgi:hypothetical protein